MLNDTIKFYNSLTKKVETFTPINPNNIGMYWCGPTVYGRAHIGNLRSSVVADLFYRILKSQYANVTYVRNYTDVDDKIIEKSKTENVLIQHIISKYTSLYIEDMLWIGNLPPSHAPFATNHINEMIELISKLIDYNYAYVVADHVFFEINLFQSHGALSNRNSNNENAESRLPSSVLKRNQEDFVLWKPSKDGEPAWESPWGKGRPGWHIECSAMAKKYLGETFDLHGGGADLMFPHHENEITQSCAAHSTDRMANYWVHSGMLNLNNDKMSKSAGNIITAEVLKNKNISGDALRLLFLSTHYRSVLSFTEDNLNQSRLTLTKWYEKTKNVKFDNNFSNIDNKIKELLYNDVNTPAVITRLHELYENSEYVELLSVLKFLGFKMQPIEYNEKNIMELAEKRAAAKLSKDYELSDKLREEIVSMGFEVNDLPNGKMTVKQKYLF